MAFNLRLRYDGKQYLAAGIVLISVGIFSAGFGFVERDHFESMKSWPVIKAEVTQVFEHYKDGYSDPKYKGNHLYIESYTIHLNFKADGNSYSRAYSKTTYSGERNMDVIYNPKDPGEAYLASDPPNSPQYYSYGVIAGVLGIFVFCGAFEKNKTRKDKRK